MDEKTLNAAIKYSEINLSVIPIEPGGKKPLVKWEGYQDQAAGPEEIREWFIKWPKANVAVVTGAISNLDAVDVDSKQGEDALIEALGDQLSEFNPPRSKTPRGGSHCFVKATGEGNKTGFLAGVDFRGEGGYVVMPPSRGSNGNAYSWMPGLSIFELEPPRAPDSLLKIIMHSLYRGDNIDPLTANICQHLPTIANITFEEPGRDETLFHLANHLVKSAMPLVSIEKYLDFFASHCTPPFPESEKRAKIKSALERTHKREKGLTEEIRDLICQHSGNISLTFANNCLQLPTREEKKKVQTIFGRLVKEGLLERTGRIAGEYRIVEREFETVNLDDLEIGETVDIKFPFGIERFIEIMPKDLIVIAGTPNSGKTALMLETVRLNMLNHKCWYFSTEMGRHNAKRRLQKHKDCSAWPFKFIDDFPNYFDVLRPNAFNFIDYVEVLDGEFYKIPGILAGIQKKLKGGIAVVALQKNPGKDYAIGGTSTTAKPALFCSIDSDFPGAIIKLVKAKNFMDINPNGFIHKFKIVDGINIIPQGTWGLEGE